MLYRHRTDSGLTVYRSPLLQDAGVPHAFSTRGGGVSQGPFESLNLGVLSDPQQADAVANVQENYRRLRVAIGCPDRERCWVHQVHGREVKVVRPSEAFECGQHADALVIDDPARLVSVKFADCVPVLLATRDGRAVAAVHAGWRGVIAGAVVAGARALCDLSGQPAASLLAAIGPCISFDHFEVGPEVLSAFRSAFADASLIRPAGEKGFVDLPRAIAAQLQSVGVREECIDSTDRCTYRDRDEFFSHRRDGAITGRMAAIIGPKEN